METFGRKRSCNDSISFLIHFLPKMNADEKNVLQFMEAEQIEFAELVYLSATLAVQFLYFLKKNELFILLSPL